MENIFLTRANELYEDMVADRRAIHTFGGLGYDLEPTTELVKEKLTAWGIEHKEICKSGIMADIGSGSPVFLLRGDMDALPVEEQSGLDFAATNGTCHCCGHDLHTTMLLYAAKMLKEREHELKGTVRLMFQPAEEGGGGARAMVDAGVLENPTVDAGMAMHVAVATDISHARTIHYSKGPAFAESDGVTITIKGKGGHGAQPHTAVDPITIAASVIHNLQHIISMEVGSDQRAVLTFGSIHGGTAANVITSEVVMKGSIRTYDPKLAAFIQQRVREIAEGTAAALRAEAIVDIRVGLAPVYNDPALCDTLFPLIEEVTGEGATAMMDYPTSYGSEDFSEITSRIPAVMLKIGAGSKDEGYEHPIHHPAALFDESILPYGAAIHANCAHKWLKSQAAK